MRLSLRCSFLRRLSGSRTRSTDTTLYTRILISGTGSSPYERTFQHENAIIVLYDIEEDANHGHVEAFFPAGLDTLIEDGSGWIVAQAGPTLVGVRPLQGFGVVRYGRGGRGLRSHHRQNGFLVEATTLDAAGDLDQFVAKLKSSELNYSFGTRWRVGKLYNKWWRRVVICLSGCPNAQRPTGRPLPNPTFRRPISHRRERAARNHVRRRATDSRRQLNRADRHPP